MGYNTDVLESAKNFKMAQLDKFPSTRYQGSKRKILPWIWGHLKNLDFHTALDLFGGTGSVSYLLKKMGKQVTYNDHLRFNHYIGLALIENEAVNLTAADIEFTLRPAPNLSNRFVASTFHGIYFTDEENEWIDNVVARISGLDGDHATLRFRKALLYYSLFQSCLIKRPFNLFHRRNLYFRFAKVKRSFSNKTTWDKPFKHHFLTFCEAANRAVFKGAHPCRAICHDALEVPNCSYDLVYVDPPYLFNDGDNTSSNYLRRYHFLEGLCNYSNWAELIDYSTRNLRMKTILSNAWTTRDDQSDALDALLDRFSKSIIVISYKRFGVPSIDTLIRMLKRHGRRVRSHSRHYIYALNHQNGDAKLNREVLLIAE